MRRFRSSEIWQVVNRPRWRGAISHSKSFSTSVSPPNSKSAWSIRRSLYLVLRIGAITTTGATLCVCSATLYVYSRPPYSFKGFYAKTQPLMELSNRLYRYLSLSMDPTSNSDTLSAIQDEDPSTPPYYYNPYASAFIIGATCGVQLYLYYVMVLDQLVKDYFKPLPHKLLPRTSTKDKHKHRFTLVLDLNETLVSSDWSLKSNRDKQTIGRPGLDAFLQRTNDYGYEVVLYTDETRPKVDLLLFGPLEIGNYIRYVQTRGSNKSQDGKLYRDLSRLNRDPSRILYVSGHALESCLQPENCVPIKPWKKEQVDDTTLTDLLPFLEYVANERPGDIRSVLSSFKGKDIAVEFIASKYEQM